MAGANGKRLAIAYAVLSALFALMLGFSASTKLTLDPRAVHTIHEVIGVPLGLFPALAACEIAGAIGLVAGIFRPKLGVAAAVGLVLYFIGAVAAHASAGDWAGIKAPILPLVLSVVALTLRWTSMRRG